MIVISASGLNKSYGTELILENVSFHINEGDRVAIVGRNGAGKTTLLNILSGSLAADSGSCFIAGDSSLGYLRQRDNFDSERTVMEEINEIFSGLADMEKEMAHLSSEIAANAEDGKDSAALWARLNELQDEFERRGGYTYRSEITGILTSMAFGEEYYGQKTGQLSGGERTRLALACLLLRKPDILFLDEPTNHLDIGTLKWLEQYLKGYRGTIVLISHDRYFLDQTVNKVFELREHRLTCYEGNYSEYAEKRRALREAELRAYERQHAEIRRQEDIIRRYKERGTEHLAKRAASREKRLAHVERLEKPRSAGRAMNIRFHQEFASGGEVLQAEGLGMSFGAGTAGGKFLFRNVSFDIKRGERVCIVGRNGIGKTTLLRMITEELRPETGWLRIGYNVEFGYYDQGQQLLHDGLTVMDEVHNDYRLYTDGEIRGMLGRFLFRDDMVFRRVASLSGGEKARLALLKLMMSGANCLVLDEPTNHLDIESKEAFEEALADYPGTVITVTHDRYFLNRIPDRILELTDEGITEYLGRYDYYVEKKEALASGRAYLAEMTAKREASAGKDGQNRSAAAAGPGGAGPGGAGASAAGAQKASGGVGPGLSPAQERELKKKKEAEERRREREERRLTALIESTEEEMRRLEQEMCLPGNATDPDRLAVMARSLREKREILENAYDEWEALS